MGGGEREEGSGRRGVRGGRGRGYRAHMYLHRRQTIGPRYLLTWKMCLHHRICRRQVMLQW